MKKRVFISAKEMGAKIYALRKKKKMTQMELADLVGVSYQQIQKYERGINNVSISRVNDLARALDVSVLAFTKEE